MLKWPYGIADAVAVLSENEQSSPPPGATPLWEANPASRPFTVPAGDPGRPTGPSRGTGLEPISQRLLRLAGVLSLLLILVVLNSLLNDGSASPFSPNPVAAAAERTEDAPGMRFLMDMRLSMNGAPTGTISGKGAYSGEGHIAGVGYVVKGPDGSRMPFDAILSEDAWYFRYPQYADRMPAGKEWIRVQGLPGQSDESKLSESPENTLRVLAGAGEVRVAGHERIRRVPTTRYRATITAAGMVEALRAQGKDELADEFESVTLDGPVEIEVWIDGKEMLRRIRTVTTALTDGKAVTSVVVTDLFDFGIKPSIQVPDESKVYDLTPALEDELGGLASPN